MRATLLTSPDSSPLEGERVRLGDVVAVVAVDWGQVQEEVSGLSEFNIVRGTVYGKVIRHSDEGITIAFQVFETGNVRGVLSIPLVCIEKVVILERASSA